MISTLDDGRLDVRLRPGDHLCLFYGSSGEHARAASAYIRQGLENGEKVIYIAHVRAAKDMLRLLKREGMSAYRHMTEGRLQVLASRNSYMSKGRFEPESMLDFFEKEAASALDEGYAALRVAGETGWVVPGAVEAKRLLKYENDVNGFLRGKTWLALCMFDTRKLPEDILKGVFLAHPSVLIGTRALKNFYFSGGAGSLKAAAGEGLVSMLDNLGLKGEPLR